MRTGRPLQPLDLSREARKSLMEITRSRSVPHPMVMRARVVLHAGEGWSNTRIAAELGWSLPSVGHWRRRYLEQGIAGLYDEPRPGGPRSVEDERVAVLLRKTLRTKPRAGTHWTCRSIAAETKLSKSTVHRVCQAFGLQPHRRKHFKLSTDPFFVRKVRDIVGLYLNPPDHAMVLCVDEKSQIQALDRTQPLLPIGLGYVEGVTHDYVRHGTTTSLSANVDETPTPWKFSVEGESGNEDVHGHGDVTDDGRDRGGGEGAAAAVHGDREAAGAEGGRWLHPPG